MGDASTLRDAVRDLADAFLAAGLDTPGLDARMLIAHVLDIEQITFVTHPQRLLSTTEREAIAKSKQRRLGREPVSRIIGERWFRGRPFKLGPATLDPRPDSETLIDAVLAFVEANQLEAAPSRILDVGTGTGCLLLTLLAELPEATGVGIDLSAAALAVAATNATALRIAPSRVRWVNGSGADPAPGVFNIIVANPPYIPSHDIEALAPEVREYDPMLALDGGPDGLSCYRTWLKPLLVALDKPLSMLIFEVGAGQAAAVADLLSAATSGQSTLIATARDLGGIDRCVSVVTRPLTPR